MIQKERIADFFSFLVIPILSAVFWCAYYGGRFDSTVVLLKFVLPVYIVCFVLGELIFRILPVKWSRYFKAGFWVGAFLVAPFFMFKVSYIAVTYNFPYTGKILYLLYLVGGIIGSLAVGLILWGILDLVTGMKDSRRPMQFAISRLLIVVLFFAVLSPIFKRDAEVQPDMLKEMTSYRGFVQREADIEPKHRVVFLGLDGGDWQVLEPLVEQGKMKNVESLMRRGRWGTLESIKPIRSPMVWNTIFTGQPPDKHGIVEWLLSYSQNRLVKAVWNILSEYNLRSTIINIPGTFPPEEFLGKQVSGFPYPTKTMNIYGWVLGTEKIKTGMKSLHSPSPSTARGVSVPRMGRILICLSEVEYSNLPTSILSPKISPYRPGR